jgi:hypothetical protein
MEAANNEECKYKKLEYDLIGIFQKNCTLNFLSRCEIYGNQNQIRLKAMFINFKK